MCSFVPWRSSCARADLVAKSGVATGNAVRRPHTDPADLVRPRALSYAVSRSPEPRRRANPAGGRRCCAETAASTSAKSIASTVTLSRASWSMPCVQGSREVDGRIGQGAPRMRGVRCGIRQLRITALLPKGFHEHPGAAMPNSVRNSGRDSTRPPGPATDRHRILTRGTSTSRLMRPCAGCVTLLQ